MGKSLFEFDSHTKSRNRSEKIFRGFGIFAIILGVIMLSYLLWTILSAGLSGFQQTRLNLNLAVSSEEIVNAEESVLKTAAYNEMVTGALKAQLAQNGIETELSDNELLKLLSERSGNEVRQIAISEPETLLEGREMRLFASADVDGYMKGRLTREAVKNNKNTSPALLDLVDQLQAKNLISTSFNFSFLYGTDSAETSPEVAGFGAAMIGSLAMMIVVLLLSLPIGVAASIYLEEFAPKNRLTDIVEVNISNLAAVPSIVFGILGLALFINLLGPLNDNDWLRNNSPFVGGLVLSLMTLPTIIISTRAALKAVPPSIRDAALGVGASKMQTIFHHVLPLAMPGILTGTIIGLAQALGETAPLLLVGLVGYIGHTMPDGIDAFFGGPNTVMPAQIYTWAARANPAWYEKAWAGIIVLMVFLVTMNALAIVLRKRFERRW